MHDIDCEQITIMLKLFFIPLSTQKTKPNFAVFGDQKCDFARIYQQLFISITQLSILQQQTERIEDGSGDNPPGSKEVWVVIHRRGKKYGTDPTGGQRIINAASGRCIPASGHCNRPDSACPSRYETVWGQETSHRLQGGRVRQRYDPPCRQAATGKGHP